MSEAEDLILKIIFLGASTVGKTSIFLQYFKFDGKKIKVNYIDTAGQEKFKSISQNYLKGADGVILVFDLTKKDTLNLINYWEDYINNNGKTNISKILFGNKKDLADEREITYEEGKNLAKKLNCDYYEGSAKTGENIEFIMNEISRITYFEFKKTEDNRHSLRISSSGTIKIKKKKKKCCKK